MHETVSQPSPMTPGEFELYKLREKGIDAMEKKNVRYFKEALTDIEKELKNEYLELYIAGETGLI